HAAEPAAANWDTRAALLWTAIIAERYGTAEQVLPAMAEAATRAGSARGLIAVYSSLGFGQLRLGALPEADRAARLPLTLLPRGRRGGRRRAADPAGRRLHGRPGGGRDRGRGGHRSRRAGRGPGAARAHPARARGRAQRPGPGGRRPARPGPRRRPAGADLLPGGPGPGRCRRVGLRGPVPQLRV